MTASHVRFEGPAQAALSIATQLADADGIELLSSTAPSVAGEDARVSLDLEVEGSSAAVARALASIRARLPAGASIELT